MRIDGIRGIKDLRVAFDYPVSVVAGGSIVLAEQIADAVEWDVPDLCRVVARLETDRRGSEIEPLVRDLETVLLRWRS